MTDQSSNHSDSSGPEHSLRSGGTRATVSRIGGDDSSSSLRLVTFRLEEGGPGELPPDQRGGDGQPSYRLERVIGRGGMGEVWSAEQTSLGRIVAVKRIRQSRLAKALAEERAELEFEFQQEALTAGQLEHPNIVPVHDFGLDETGNPILAMKLVDGKPWSEMVREDMDELPVTEFLARHLPVLISVTNAVGFAHSRGIVHRDLKPSQVMVGAFGEVLLMDWGLAIYVGRDGGESRPRSRALANLPTPETASGPCGTPAFMAPEQAVDHARDVGTWTDLYLLGGTLYYLLTGTTPHGGGDSAAALQSARLGVVQPPAERAPWRDVPGDLADLAMRAMEPSREGRLRSADEFLQGLRDHLSGASKLRESAALTAQARELVGSPAHGYNELSEAGYLLARAIGLWPGNADAVRLHQENCERYCRLAMRKGDLELARLQAGRLRDGRLRASLLERITARQAGEATRHRQRLLLATATLVLLGALALLGAKYQIDQGRSRDELAAAATELAFSNEVIEGKNRDLNARIVEVEAARGDLEQVLAFMLGDLKAKLEELERTDVLDEVADRAVEVFRTRSSRGESFTGESILTHAGLLVEVAGLRELQGRHVEAIAALEEASELLTNNRSLAPNLTEWDHEHASILGSLAQLLRRQGRLADALDAINEGIRLREEIVEAHPGEPMHRVRLGGSYLFLANHFQSTGDWESAVPWITEGLGLVENVPEELLGERDRLVILSDLLGLERSRAMQAGDIPAVISAAQRQAEAQRAIVTAAPGVSLHQRRLARSLSDLATVVSMQGRHDEAYEVGLEARDLVESDLVRNPRSRDALAVAAQVHSELAEVLWLAEDLDGAAESFERAVAAVETLREIDPTNIEARRRHGWLLHSRANMAEQAGNDESAAAEYERAMAVRREIVDGAPGNLTHLRLLAESMRDAGKLHARRLDAAVGERLLADSVAVWREAAGGKSDDALIESQVAIVQDFRGVALRRLGRLDEAIASHQAAWEIYERLGPEDLLASVQRMGSREEWLRTLATAERWTELLELADRDLAPEVELTRALIPHREIFRPLLRHRAASELLALEALDRLGRQEERGARLAGFLGDWGEHWELLTEEQRSQFRTMRGLAPEAFGELAGE
jgi:serine/threonine protein kinase